MTTWRGPLEPGSRSHLRNSSEKRVRNQSGSLLKEIGGLKIEHILWEGEAHQRRGRRQTERGPLGEVLWGTKPNSGDLPQQPPSALTTFPDGLVCFLDLNTGDEGPIWFLSEASEATSKDIYCPRKKSIPGFLQSAENNNSIETSMTDSPKRKRSTRNCSEHQELFI